MTNPMNAVLNMEPPKLSTDSAIEPKKISAGVAPKRLT